MKVIPLHETRSVSSFLRELADGEAQSWDSVILVAVHSDEARKKAPMLMIETISPTPMSDDLAIGRLTRAANLLAFHDDPDEG